jgi:ribosomal protein L29
MAKTDFTMVETPKNTQSKIVIRPYFDARSENMGLENYGLSLFDGVKHQEQLACLEINGINRYLTGLNEFAPEIKKLAKEDREAKVKQIRATVADLEAELASNMLDPEDKDFWNKVKLLKPDNIEFWNKIELSVGNEPMHIDINDPYDRIKLCAIEAGGFSLVAKSYEDAKSKPKPPKFYLDKEEETVSTRTEYKKLRNKALSELQKLFDKNSTKLFYVAKVVDASSTQYKKSTPLDILYENMDEFIHGDGAESKMEL